MMTDILTECGVELHLIHKILHLELCSGAAARL